MVDDILANRTILLVEDHAAVCDALSIFLETCGYRVKTYQSAESFLEVEEVPKDGIILLDQCMKGMTGLELLAELSRRGISSPIIFMSGLPDEQIYTEAIKCGATSFLHKPFSNEALLESIGAVFSMSDSSPRSFTQEP